VKKASSSFDFIVAADRCALGGVLINTSAISAKNAAENNDS